MLVVIVARTQLKAREVNIEAYGLNNGESYLLHSLDGKAIPANMKMPVGSVWDIEFVRKEVLPPHYEGVCLTNLTYIRQEHNLLAFLLQHNLNVKTGSPFNLFEGKLRFEGNLGDIAYVFPEDLCNYSGEFWFTSQALKKYDFNEKNAYFYHNSDNVIRQWLKFKYIGTAEPLDIILPNTLLKISLAKPYKSSMAAREKCFLKLSSWIL